MWVLIARGNLPPFAVFSIETLGFCVLMQMLMPLQCPVQGTDVYLRLGLYFIIIIS